jgi:hypothetical protein
VVNRTQRPIVPVVHANEIEHRRLLAVRANAGMPKDGSEAMTAPLRLKSFTVAELTGNFAASVWPGATVYVSNEAGGAVTAFSDGTNWRRVTDRAVVS